MDVVTESQSSLPKLVKVNKRFGSCCCYTDRLCSKLTDSWIEFCDMPEIPCCSETCFNEIISGMGVLDNTTKDVVEPESNIEATGENNEESSLIFLNDNPRKLEQPFEP